MHLWMLFAGALLAAVIGLSIFGVKRRLSRVQIRLMIVVPAMALGGVLAANQRDLHNVMGGFDNPCATLFDTDELLSTFLKDPYTYKTSRMCEAMRSGSQLEVEVGSLSENGDNFPNALRDAEADHRKVRLLTGKPEAAIIEDRQGAPEIFIKLDDEGGFLKYSGDEPRGAAFDALAERFKLKAPELAEWLAKRRAR